MGWVGWGIQAILEHCAGTVPHPLFVAGVGGSLLLWLFPSVQLHVRDGGVRT